MQARKQRRKAGSFSLDAFKAWLTERGAIVEPPTNPYEILRVRTCNGSAVAYKNGKGKETWPEAASALKDAFTAGELPSLSPELSARRKLRHKIESLAERDGLECWFCARGFLSSDSREVTIEHLVAKAHGGPDHPSNLVLACERCNREADNLPVASKVLMRERKRSLQVAA